MTSTALRALVIGSLVVGGAGVQADPIADFYKGKTMAMYIGVSVGGEYDLHARLIARYMAKHIPGSPTIVPQNMLGAGGIVMANYLYSIAPRDGTAMGVIQNGHPTIQAVGMPNVQYDAGKFNWIGAITPTVETMALWKTSNVHSIEDARKADVIVGSVGRSNITFTFPQMLNEFAGTKFKIVSGYRGGSEINLAMERGEVAGRNNTWSSWKVTKADWLKNKDISIIAYAGPKPRDLDGVPSLEDLAKTDDDKRVVRLIIAGTRLGRPIAATPGIPPERVKALRDAFQAAMKDPEFLKEAEASRIEVDPVRGEDLQKVVEDVLATPEHLRQRARPFLD